MKTEIGIATVHYTDKGDIIEHLSNFTSTLKVTPDAELSKQLLSIKSERDSEKLRQNADLLLASFFNKMADVELADRSEYMIDSEVVRCDKFSSGSIKTCVLRYFFTKIK